MEPLESGQIQPLGLSHAIGPPFQRGIPSILKRLKYPKPDHQSLWWTFPLAPPPPPLPPLGPRTHCRQIPGTQTPSGGVQGATRGLEPSGHPCPAQAPPWPHLAPPGPPLAPPWPPLPPPWPPLVPPAPLPFLAEETSACPSLRPRQRWELRAPALNPKR